MANVGSAAAGKTLIGAGNGASPTYASIGTNSGLTNHGVVIAQGSGPFVATSAGFTGQVLTSNGASFDPTFQSISSAGAITTITGNTGGAESPSAGNFNILGSGSITIAGSANTETVQLTGLTNHALLVGAGTATITKVGPTATAGQVLQSQGSSADPAFSTATFPSTATSTGTLLRADGTNWVATTSTYPNTNAINTLLYASSANVMAALATANSGVLTTSSTGVPSIDTTNFSVLTTGVQMKGNNTNTAPPAGFIGEQLIANLAAGSATSLTTNTPKTVISVSLTAGVWDVTGVLAFLANTTTSTTQYTASVSATNNTPGSTAGIDLVAINSVGGIVGFGPTLVVPAVRVLLSGTTTYYLVANAVFTVSTMTAYGSIKAVRVG